MLTIEQNFCMCVSKVMVVQVIRSFFFREKDISQLQPCTIAKLLLNLKKENDFLT